MRFGIVLDHIFERHANPAGHPERPDRIRSIIGAVEAWEHFPELHRIAPEDAREEWIKGVHTPGHFNEIKRTAGQPYSQLDPDTYTGPESYQIALKAAGSVVRLMGRLLEGEIDCGFAAVRPPGHHAESNRAMGFCLFNTVAVAADRALAREGTQKVAIVDFDVHHGNGTQEIFYARPDVLYISQHQYPFYPGTGHFREVGDQEGTGFTVNFPIRAGMSNFFYCSLFQDFVRPILRQYKPDLILVSAGYDAHRDDPIAGMDLDDKAYGEITNLLNSVAQEVCKGRILYVLEGGYHLQALAQSVLTTISTTLNPQKHEIKETQVSEYAQYRNELSSHFSQWWKL